MEITGKIILELPERSGTSARTGSEWKLKSFVLETFDQYPRKMMFEVFGAERIAAMNIVVGESYTISFDIDAREFVGADGRSRWFNSIRAFRAAPAGAAAPAAAAPYDMPFAPAPAAAPVQPQAAPAPAVVTAPAQESADDLPF